MLVLGIESSCDETAAAIVSGEREILGEVVLSQLDEHRPFGGVVPEIAARSHLAHMDRLVAEAMRRAGVGFSDLDAVAATGGPGLIGGVIVGVMTGKAIALASGKPFLAVNHLEGHALTPRLTHDIPFPYLLLLASGGHCQLLAVEGVGKYTRLGTTIDDAAGEAFDKVAKMAGLGYPGGPAVEKAAASGNAARFTLPRPMKGKPGCDFSFSGLKNAARLLIESLPQPLSEQDRADVARAFQDAVADSMADRVRRGVREMKARFPATRHLVVAGGVAANTALRQVLVRIGAETGLEFLAPPLKLCTDNAAMIAWAGIERLRLGQSDGLDFAPRPRWPLDPNAKKGAKA
ncbi:O-sialoglycoprotein endopeptidase [Magnetospirillum sp. XM-1]|uniref:tRNA (adenosine(37)-N6)-threonylcarbamoyltransferase complex transferase subunit TsaD n=1 Tax=Magnetospirillum sp. XM-1 TaxID=1663591 RepID=UPI00073E03D5|nr:tRNA (adenosine(37)-N6)-threonylcarbamoyltransferase complex transferase subunit TsaD [Magnetospirillum sp. XM-1]CUW37767.1 O-sialoglycoprotein endopeptidase [Magnetospirillum sp. XM-1]